MHEHKWVTSPGSNEIELCARNGCTVMRAVRSGFWQRKKGAHWRDPAYEQVPPCAGTDTPPAQPSALERVRQHLSIVRDTVTTGGMKLTAAHIEQAERALASLVAEVRADEREACAAIGDALAAEAREECDMAWAGGAATTADKIRARKG